MHSESEDLERGEHIVLSLSVKHYRWQWIASFSKNPT